jgi:hypothetical protein
MADEHGDYLYSQWLQRKASAMKRPVLSCGCRNDGRSTYVRGTCDCIVCREHRDDEHEHAEEPKKVEALRPIGAVEREAPRLEHVEVAMAGILSRDGNEIISAPWPTTAQSNPIDDLLAFANALGYNVRRRQDHPKPTRTPWWKPNTWRRNG